MVEHGRVLSAHADAWEAEGCARVASGGGVARIRGARLMASGLPHAKWNNADVTAPDLAAGALAEWYAWRNVPWGIRVPLGMSVELGSPLFVKRSFGLERETFRPASDDEVTFRPAGPHELESFVGAESSAFGDPSDLARRWVAPVFGRPGFEHWFAQRRQDILAVCSAVWSDADAGPAVMLTGLCPVSRDGLAVLAPLATAVLRHAFDREPDVLAHAHAGPKEDVQSFMSLGFVEVPGFVVRVMRRDQS